MSGWILVALGSNQGPSRRVLRSAMARLRADYGRTGFRASSVWRSAPVDCPPGAPDFLNAVVALPRGAVDGPPEAFLAELRALEAAAGRAAVRRRNAPRVLDLDLLVFGDCRQDRADCILPHPRALGRRFVLEPAAEVVPELIWPGTDRRVDALCRELRVEQAGQPIERLDPTDRVP